MVVTRSQSQATSLASYLHNSLALTGFRMSLSTVHAAPIGNLTLYLRQNSLCQGQDLVKLFGMKGPSYLSKSETRWNIVAYVTDHLIRQEMADPRCACGRHTFSASFVETN